MQGQGSNPQPHGFIDFFFCFCCCFTLLYFTFPYFTLLYFTLPYFTLPYFTLLYLTLLYFTLLYFTLPYFTLLYFTLPYFTLPYWIHNSPIEARDRTCNLMVPGQIRFHCTTREPRFCLYLIFIIPFLFFSFGFSLLFFL